MALVVISPLQAATWTQGILSTSSDSPAQIEAIPLQVTATQVSPPSITITTYATGTYTISRKDPSATTWTQVASGVSISASGTWKDTNVTAGTMYEYQFVNTASASWSSTWEPNFSFFATGYLTAGIQVDQTQPKGMMAVVTANDLPGNMPAQYAQYKQDLVADGWQVREIQVPRCPDNYTAMGNGALATVKVTSGGLSSIATGSLVHITNPSGKVALGTVTVSAGAVTGVNTNVGINGVTVWGNQGSGFNIGDALTLSGGSVTAGNKAILTSNITVTQTPLTSAYAVTGGTGYTDGQTVTITGQVSHAQAVCTLEVFNGAIDFIDPPASAPGFIANEPLTMTGNTTGSGLGPITAVLSGGNLSYANIYATGTGYTNGETGTVTGNTSGATAQVTLQVTQGFLQGVTVVSSQSGFINSENLTLSGTATGSGAPLFVGQATQTGPLSSIKVITGGTGYTNGTSVQITGGTSPAQGTLNVTSGAITSVTLSSNGDGFVSGNLVNLLPMTTTAPALSVLTVNNSNRGSPVAISSGGSGYSDNDTVTIKGNTSGATATGSIIAPSGTVTGVSVVLANAGAAGSFTTGEPLTFTTTLGGSGLAGIVGAPLDNHLLIRSAIQAIYNTFPGQLKNVVMVGKVPLCRSGLSDGGSADGHGNECPYGADAFYAEMKGVIGVDWTDTGDNTTTVNYTDYNLPGDNQFDQNNISQININGTGQVQLGYGRIDLAQGVQTEIPAEIEYFTKLHNYKVADPSFLPGRNVCDRVLYPNEREADLMSMPGAVGINNINFITNGNLPKVQTGQDPDQLFSTQNGPFLFYFKGDGGPGAGVNGKAVFWTGMQSHWGFWYQASLDTSGANLMQQRLGENSFTLDFTWNIAGLRYFYHRMGMGLDAGDMMKTSINNQGWTTGPYTYKYNTTSLSNSSLGDFHGAFFMEQMGDPALRLFMFAPPTALSIVKTGGNPVLNWTASTEPTVTGYHVYRAPNANGVYTRLTSTPVSGTTYTDTTATSGSYAYMVRAIRLENTGGGSFYNASLGTTQSFNVTAAPTPVVITTTSLPNVFWNSPSSLTLSATGGDPQYVWSLAGGTTLPPGLALSPLGVISGTTQATGTFNFTIEATDQIGQFTTQPLSLTVNQNSQSVIYPNETSYTSSVPNQVNSSFGTTEADLVLGGTTVNETFQRYDLSGVTANNSVAKATLFLYVTSGTAAGTFAQVQANLLADSVDNWIANGNSVHFSAIASGGTNKTLITTDVPSGYANGTLITLAGLGSATPTTSYATTVVNSTQFTIPVAFSSSWVYDQALSYVSTVAMNYTTRPTTYDTNVPTLNASGTDTPGTYLQVDVTSYVNEVLANFPDKLMGIRLFTQTAQTVALGSLNSFGSSIPYLVIQTSNAPNIVVNSPKANPAFLSSGSSILLNTTVTAIPSRASSVAVQWSQVSGPGTTTFTNPTSVITGASFSAPGTYVLQITANDGVETSSQTITVVTSNTPVSGPTDSMVLRLPFDETSGTTAFDQSGFSNNGALQGPATWTTAGKINGALLLSNSNSHVKVADSATHQLDGQQAMSFSFWMNPTTLDTVSNFRDIISKNLAYSFQLRQNVLFITVNPGNANSVGQQATGAIVAGTWFHVVVVFDGSNPNNVMLTYLNGVPVKGSTATSTTILNVLREASSPLYIGGGSDTDTDGFNGMIDEVRIYNRALTFAEVQALYQAVPSEVGPVITTNPSLTGSIGNALALSATVTGQGTLTYNWNQVSGPATLNITNATTTSASTTPTQPGAYGLQFLASDGIISSFANVAATITGQTYSGWAAQNGLTGNNALMTAKLEPDGLSNLYKYALGLNPAVNYNPGAPGQPFVQMQNISGANYLTLSFTGNAPDVTYTVQASNDLSTWTNVQSWPSGGTPPGTVTVQDTQATSASAKRFMRLLMTSP